MKRIDSSMNMNLGIRTGMIGLGLLGGLVPHIATAQKPAAAPAKLTVEQVMAKYIAATGGEAAYNKITNSVTNGTLEVIPQGIKGTFKATAKAPDMIVLVQNIAGIGETRQGYDGKIAWSKDPINGLRTLDGPELAAIRRDAAFNAPIHWKSIYKTAQVLGIKKVDGKDAYAIQLIPAEGKPVTQYFDAKSFLLVRIDTVQAGAQGEVPIQAMLSDYRSLDGIKAPYTIRQKLGPVEVVLKTTETRNNVPIDPAVFARPAEGQK